MGSEVEKVEYLYNICESSARHEHPVLLLGSEGAVTYFLAVTRLSRIVHLITDADVLVAWRFPAAVCHASVTQSPTPLPDRSVVCTTADGSVWRLPVSALMDLESDMSINAAKRPQEDESAGPASKKRCLKPAGDVTNEDVFTSLLGSDSTESHASSQSEGGTKETFAVGQIGLSDCRKDVAGGFKLLTIAGAKAAIETDCGLFVLTSEGSQTTLMCFANPAFGREAKKGYSAPQMCWSLACPSPKGGGKVAAGGTNELCYVSTSPWSSSTLSLAQERVKLSSPLVSRLLDLNATLSFQTVVLWAFSDGSVFASASHSITEECKWSLVCHLREPAEAIHPVITCKPADGKPCDLLLVTGRYGRVVAVTERATGVNGPPVLFNEYRIEGPILCSCVIHCRVSSSEVVPCLVWSTGLRLNWARLDICRGSCVNNTPRLTTKALSSAVGVCCLWPKEADGCFGRLCSGEVVCFPVAEPLSTTDLSPAPVVRTRLQEALTALQAASQETNDLVKHESEQNKVLSRLNFILHVFAGLKSVPSLQKEKETSSQRSHNKAFSVNFFPQLKQSLSGMRSAGVCCHVNNHTSQNLFSGWSAVFSVTYRSMRAVRRPAWSVVLSLVGLSGGEARCLWVPVLAPDLFDHLNIACSIHFDVSSLLSGNDPVNVSFESSNVVSPVAYAQLDVLSFASIVDEQGTDCCDVVKAWPLQMMQDIARLSLLEQSTTSSDANGCEDKQHESESLSLLVSPSSLVGAEVAAGAQDIASQIRACLRRLLDGCWFKVTDDSGCVDDDGVVEVSLKTAAGQDILLAAGAVISERSDTFPSDPSDAVQEGTVETLASRETSEPERIVWLTVSACSRQLLCAVHAALVQRAKSNSSLKAARRLLTTESVHSLRQRLLLLQPSMRSLRDSYVSLQDYQHGHRLKSHSQDGLLKLVAELQESLWEVYSSMTDFPWLIA